MSHPALEQLERADIQGSKHILLSEGAQARNCKLADIPQDFLRLAHTNGLEQGLSDDRTYACTTEATQRRRSPKKQKKIAQSYLKLQIQISLLTNNAALMLALRWIPPSSTTFPVRPKRTSSRHEFRSSTETASLPLQKVQRPSCKAAF